MAIIKQLHVNGTKRAIQADGERSLLEVLREDLQLTGSKYGCGEGRCGACTVLIGGKATRSCRTTIEEVGNRPVITIEGLERNGKLHPLQTAFLENDAMQCGFCTAGMIMSGASLLNQKPNPTDEEILTAMQGNICRCGTYARIMAAMRQAAGRKGGPTR
jgi:aerobic-type carbon monoxide dehydrogenase small subunit (CoxS/CutS family)